MTRRTLAACALACLPLLVGCGSSTTVDRNVTRTHSGGIIGRAATIGGIAVNPDWDTLEDITEGKQKGWKKVTSADGKETVYFKPVEGDQGEGIIGWIPFIKQDPEKARIRRWDANRDGYLDPRERHSEGLYKARLSIAKQKAEIRAMNRRNAARQAQNNRR
jgi:hypothetical protein